MLYADGITNMHPRMACMHVWLLYAQPVCSVQGTNINCYDCAYII